jgi:hypothetical protein
MMVLLSHSPNVMPERRAASFAASRASGSIPFTLHGKPGFIATYSNGHTHYTELVRARVQPQNPNPES